MLEPACGGAATPWEPTWGGTRDDRKVHFEPLGSTMPASPPPRFLLKLI
jgi:hypothetical protein